MKTKLGTLFYDGSCRFCTDGVMRLRGWLDRRGVKIAPFEVAEGEAIPEEMRFRCVDGRELGGADAVLLVIGARWWGKPLEWLGRLPGIHGFLDAGYRWVARRRHCIGGTCARCGDSSRPFPSDQPFPQPAANCPVKICWAELTPGDRWSLPTSHPTGAPGRGTLPASPGPSWTPAVAP